MKSFIRLICVAATLIFAAQTGCTVNTPSDTLPATSVDVVNISVNPTEYAPSPTPTPVITNTPEPSPAIPTNTPIPFMYSDEGLIGLKKLVQLGFYEEYKFSQAEVRLNRYNPFATEIRARRSKLLSLDKSMAEQAEQVFQAVVNSVIDTAGIAECYKDGIEIKLNCKMPSWKAMVALLWAYGNDGAEDLLNRHYALTVAIDQKSAVGTLVFDDFNTIITGTEESKRISAVFVYSYHCTVYDDEFNKCDYTMPELPEGYIETLGLPLDNMSYYNSWYNGRQGSSRHHLGMDLHERRDAPIYSCTDGVVTGIGFDRIAGYYVVVTDSYGYEYHYYHMVRATDFIAIGDAVQRGALIGNVGNTGNSSSNHLHLAIINPQYVHLNPYLIMCQIRDYING